MSKKKIHISKTSDKTLCGKIHGEGVDAVLTRAGATCATCLRVFEDVTPPTRTGRLSSAAPPMQNIPIRTKEGKAIREAFVGIGCSRTGKTEAMEQIVPGDPHSFVAVDPSSLSDRTAILKTQGGKILDVHHDPKLLQGYWTRQKFVNRYWRKHPLSGAELMAVPFGKEARRLWWMERRMRANRRPL